MHCVLLGVTKKLLSLWFAKDFSTKPYSAFNKFDLINKHLSKLRPPLFVKRAPRSLSDLKYWKASEYRSFLLYYGPVVIKDVISPAQYGHFLLLSESIFILLKEEIQSQELQKAENMLEYFVSSVGDLYEPRFLTLNFHLLLHLPENVRQLGLVWAYSCFPFEDANGFLMKLVKGTQSVHSQLLDSISIIHGLPYLEKNCVQPLSKAEQLLNRMKRRFSRYSTCLYQNVYALGKVTELSVDNVSRDCFVAVANALNKPPTGQLLRFKRIRYNGNVIHSREYTRVKVRNSHTISFLETDTGSLGYGIIHYFLLYRPENSNEKHAIVIVTKLVEDNSLDQFPFDPVINEQQMTHFKNFHEPNFENQSKAIHVENIKQLCVYMNNDTRVTICTSPNSVEME